MKITGGIVPPFQPGTNYLGNLRPQPWLTNVYFAGGVNGSDPATLVGYNSCYDGPLTIAGPNFTNTYASGLFITACSHLQWFLGGSASRFVSDFGFLDRWGIGGGPVTLTISLDGSLLYRGSVLYGADDSD